MEKKLIAFEDVRQLAQKMHNAGLREIEWRGADWSVRLRYPGGKTIAEPPPPPPPLPPTVAETSLLPVCSPMPGRLLLSHPSHGEAFVSEGLRVEPDDILALVQVGPLYLPVRSPVGRDAQKPCRDGGERAGVRQHDRAVAACGRRLREVIRAPYRAKLFMSYPRWA